MVYTLATGAEPARETVTIDGSTTSNSQSSTHDLVFDASASDKVVVIVTGENGNPGDLNGKVNSLTYDGVAMTKAVGRLPIGSAPSAAFDQTYNDIWYLDDPAAATASANVNDLNSGVPGNIRASVNSRGVITAIRLSGTAPGVGATAISAQEVKSVSVLAATSGGMVLASLGMGGDGNTANVTVVNTTPTTAELTAVLQGSSWNGHVTSRTSVASPGFVPSIFTGGNTIGTHTIAAEFPGALIGGGETYASWIATFPGVGLLSGVNDDPDMDGIGNGMEMVLGGNPATGMDTALLPTIELVTNPVGSPAIPAGDYVLFTYRRSDLSVAAGLTADCETDTDLVAPWTTATTAPGVVIQVDDNFFTPPAAADTDRVRVYVPRGANTRIFGRLNIVVP
jgi:hypothetical protein